MITTIKMEIAEIDGSIFLHAGGESNHIGQVLDGLVVRIKWAQMDCFIKEQLESLALRMAEEAGGSLPALKKEG
jgi:hypothetical protein